MVMEMVLLMVLRVVMQRLCERDGVGGHDGQQECRRVCVREGLEVRQSGHGRGHVQRTRRDGCKLACGIRGRLVPRRAIGCRGLVVCV